VQGVGGTWKDLTDNVNLMAGNLTSQVRNIAAVTTAVANGDLSKKITVDVRGEILELKDTINTMVDQLRSFAAEVTRVAREVGTEGKLGGQAYVQGVAGTWKDLTDNVNLMAANLTDQVRGIAVVVTAVANGNLKRQLTVEAKGEIAELAETINNMTDTLATFADQVTSVAREVGVEGKLGGQASVPGAAGTWKDLTDNVNQLAANLTTQVRAIAEVATAVTKGDLTRSITVEALGEVAALKDNINEMIRNLKDTTLKNSQQDWLKTNLAKFSRMLQGQRDLLTVGRLILSELAPVVSAQQGVFYTMEAGDSEPSLKLLASYAHRERHNNGSDRFSLGEGLVGQCALEKSKIVLTNVPNDYIKIASGLGEASPFNVLVLPVVFEGQVKAVMELASFEQFSPTHQGFLDQLMESIGIVLNTIEANTRTEDLLEQSQSLAKELQSQQQELQQTNQQLGEKAKLLADQNVEVERKNREVEQARQALEEKAKQLALTSKYKSEFLANMSHELRTPLNSLLILSDELSKNKDQNLSQKQVQFAKTIHDSGNDLLALINDILDLSKIESGTVIVDAGEVAFRDLHDYVERTFRHVAEAKRLDFDVTRAPALPRAIHTDAKRLQQILKNLLSNAFKFTEKGTVLLRVEPVREGWSAENETLNRSKSVMAFEVRDTGIGISPDKQQIIFEAFQQADGSTSRKYGGTGLGLAISRELARLLGGEIRLVSAPGAGSSFTLFLPQHYVPGKSPKRQALLPPPQEFTVPAPVETDAAQPAPEPPSSPPIQFDDDGDNIQPDDRVLLMVENDAGFARFLLEVARESGFKGLISSRGSDALALVRQRRINAITLDINLPDIDGWRVLARLKDDPATRHIPVHIITTEEERQRGLRMGAIGVLTKPLKSKEELRDVFARIQGFVKPRTKGLLVATNDGLRRNHLSELAQSENVRIETADSARETLEKLRDGHFEAVVIDLDPPDMSAFNLVEEIKKDPHLADIPVIACVSRDLSKKEENQLKRLAQTTNFKEVRSLERLLDEAALFLHCDINRLPEAKRAAIQKLHETETVLRDKSILIVDDDIRNIFAMTSLLERYQMRILSAETGKTALDRLHDVEDIDAVLMDIMMPDMDGYDTMRAIRKHAKFRVLPVIALTAKAMKGDREKCIDAGASDYIAKPVDSAELLSMLRFWLYR
jgi:signal transduction histidine kinase/DNA-binding response OmpR family regulator/HAMP domain-containing protein